MRKMIVFVFSILLLTISCNKKIGCPNDFYNNFDKKKTTTKSMNSNKPQKKKGATSGKMGPQ